MVLIDSVRKSNYITTGIYSRGNIYISEDAALTVESAAASKESVGIECAGTFSAQENATIQAESGGEQAGIVWYSTFFDYGATINSEIDAINGVQSK